MHAPIWQPQANKTDRFNPPQVDETPSMKFWEYLAWSKQSFKMKRMFSKKGLVESSKEEKIEDVESDADIQEYFLPFEFFNPLDYWCY